MLRGCVRLSVVYDVWTDFNSLAYHIPASSVNYQKNSFFNRRVRDWNCRLSIQYSLNNSVVIGISMNCRGLYEVLNQLWWKGVATLPWGARDIHLYFNQHYTYAPGALCYALSTAGTSAATGHSGVFNLLKFDRISKKERKIMYCG